LYLNMKPGGPGLRGSGNLDKSRIQ